MRLVDRWLTLLVIGILLGIGTRYVYTEISRMHQMAAMCGCYGQAKVEKFDENDDFDSGPKFVK